MALHGSSWDSALRGFSKGLEGAIICITHRGAELRVTQCLREQSRGMLGSQTCLCPEPSWQLPAFPEADGRRLPQRGCGALCRSSHGKFRPLVFLITPGVLFFPWCECKLGQGHSWYPVPHIPSLPRTAVTNKSTSHGKLAGVTKRLGYQPDDF